MNDAATRDPLPDDDEDERARQRATVERAIMDRARRSSERDKVKGPRRTVQHVVALAAAIALVTVIFLGFDAFLTSVQKVMQVIDAEEAKQKQEQATPPPDEPIPAYVVPGE